MSNEKANKPESSLREPTGKIELGDLSFSSRLSVAMVREAKISTSIDLASEDGKTVLKLFTDPLQLAQYSYHLYRRRLPAEMSFEKFDELLGPEELDTIKLEMGAAIKGFFPFVKMIFTEMGDFLSGNMTLDEAVDRAKKLEAKTANPDHSGPSTLPPDLVSGEKSTT